MPVTIKASANAIKEAQSSGDLENIDFDGYHIFKLVKVEVGKSKAGNPQMVCHWKLVGMTRQGVKPEKNYWPLKDYVQLEGEETEWKRAEFLLAMGVDTAARGGTKLEVEPKKPGTVIGKLAICRLGLETYEGEERGKIKKVLPYVAPVDGGAVDNPEDLDEGDIPDTDEIVEVEEVVETTETTGYVPWEREALKDAGKDQIKEVATSFGIEIIKGMKLADVLDAIMEAQEAYLKGDDEPAEGGEVDEEDEPF
jgi:hypothetical protein